MWVARLGAGVLWISTHMKVANQLKFLPRLESLRGIAAVSVVGYHAYGMRHDTAVTGMAPVVLFFVLSGFVLSRSLENNPNPLTFFRSRIFRLVPAAAATVFLLSGLYWQFGFFVGYRTSYDWTNILLNALMVRSDINGVMWSMTVECFASPLILACFLVYKKLGPAPLVTLSFVLFALSFWGSYVHLLGGFTTLAPLYAFVTGVILHFAYTRGFKSKAIVFPAIIAAAIILVCGLRKQTSLTILFESTASGGLIYLVAIGRHNKAFAFLDFAPVRFIGRISYSFYLLHPIGLSLAERSGASSALFLFALAVIFTTPMAWLSWRTVELPFVQICRSNNSNDVVADDRRLDDRMSVTAAHVVGVVDRDAGSG